MDSFFALFFRFSFGLLCHALLLPLITPCRFGRRARRWAWLGVSALGSLLAVPLILLVDSVGVLFVLEAAFTLALYCAAYMFLSEGSRMRSLFMFSVYGTYFMFLLAFASCLSQVFFNGSHYATAAIRTLFMALYGLSLRFSPLVRRLRATSQLSVGWRSPAVFSCSSCLTVYAAALIFSILQLDPGIRLGITGVLAALITSAYAVSGRMILLLSREQAAREAETQRKLMERQLAAEREYVAQAKAPDGDTITLDLGRYGAVGESFYTFSDPTPTDTPGTWNVVRDGVVVEETSVRYDLVKGVLDYETFEGGANDGRR